MTVLISGNFRLLLLLFRLLSLPLGIENSCLYPLLESIEEETDGAKFSVDRPTKV